MFDTIVALATPPIKSALAIVRLSGDDSLAVASAVFSRDLTVVPAGHYFGRLTHKGEFIDEAVALVFCLTHRFPRFLGPSRRLAGHRFSCPRRAYVFAACCLEKHRIFRMFPGLCRAYVARPLLYIGVHPCQCPA